MEGLDATVALQAGCDERRELDCDEWRCPHSCCFGPRCHELRTALHNSVFPNRSSVPVSRARARATGCALERSRCDRRHISRAVWHCPPWAQVRHALPLARDGLARRRDKPRLKWDLTFDMSGSPKAAMQALGCPLDGRVRRHVVRMLGPERPQPIARLDQCHQEEGHSAEREAPVGEASLAEIHVRKYEGTQGEEDRTDEQRCGSCPTSRRAHEVRCPHGGERNQPQHKCDGCESYGCANTTLGTRRAYSPMHGRQRQRNGDNSCEEPVAGVHVV